MTRLSPTLTAKDGKICCAGCGHAFAKVRTSWKAHAVVTEVPARTLPGASAGLHGEVTVRQFSCPSCHRLIDTETALKGDPFLEDVVEV
jgi:acetone carboxylase gamma subunit